MIYTANYGGSSFSTLKLGPGGEVMMLLLVILVLLEMLIMLVLMFVGRADFGKI